MRRPNAEKYYNPDPKYLRELIEQSGESIRNSARLIRVSAREMRRFVSLGNDYLPAPYSVQVALEVLAETSEAIRKRIERHVSSRGAAAAGGDGASS